MSKEAVFTMKLEPELREAFMAEAEVCYRSVLQVVRELMREFVERQRPERRQLGFPFLVGDDGQRMRHQPLESHFGDQGIRIGFIDQPIAHQHAQHLRHGQSVFGNNVGRLLCHENQSGKMIQAL